MILTLLVACADLAPVTAASPARELPAQTWPAATVALRAGDVDRDGYADLWLGRPGAPLELHRGGPGGLDPANWRTGPLTTRHMASGDADGDGVRDLVGVDGARLRLWTVTSTVTELPLSVGATQQPIVEVAHADGRAGWAFVDASTPAPWGPAAEVHHLHLDAAQRPVLTGLAAVWEGWPTLSAGDLDGDGWGDLRITVESAAGCGRMTTISHGSAAGGEAAVSWLPLVEPVGCAGGQVWAVGDVDADGRAESVLDHAGAAIGEDGAWSTWDAAWDHAARTSGACGEIHAWAAGDLDADGFHETALTRGSTVLLFAGGPAGVALSPARTLEVSGCVSAVVPAGDVDGDGLDDLAVASDQVSLLLGAPLDHDGDGALPPEDCDDHAPAIHPGALDLPGDGVDQDCDGLPGCLADLDGDGFGGTPIAAGGQPCAPLPGPDCDDSRVDVHPGAVELPGDEVDEDCDGRWACFTDRDGDGWGAPHIVWSACGGRADVVRPGDCDDTQSAVSPDATLLVGGDDDDEDCDGRVECLQDRDGDGHGSLVVVEAPDRTCRHPGMTARPGDCDDRDPRVHSDGAEQPGNRVDEDCDGWLDCYADQDGDGYGLGVAEDAIAVGGRCTGAGFASRRGDCNDGDRTWHPGAADPDWTARSGRAPSPLTGAMDAAWVFVLGDEDCDGVSRCPVDTDGDGWAPASGPWVEVAASVCAAPFATKIGDCAPADPTLHPSAFHDYGSDHWPPPDHLGDSTDDDCDGAVECFVDADGDGLGTLPGELRGPAAGTCAAPGWSAAGGDCDDLRPGIPGPVELSGDGLDEDCDGLLACFGDADGDGAAGTAVSLPTPYPAWSCAELDDPLQPGARAQAVPADCDDADPLTTSSPEVFGDPVDDDCDGSLGPRLRIEHWLDDEYAGDVFVVSGLADGAHVLPLVSVIGAGAGPCPPELVGACVGLRRPVPQLPEIAYGGEATWVPMYMPWIDKIWVQAWVEQGGVWFGSEVVFGQPHE